MRLSKRLAKVSDYFEKAGHSDLAIIVDVVSAIREGNPQMKGETLHVEAAPSHLNTGDRVVVSVKSQKLGLNQGAVGKVKGGDGSSGSPFEILFGRQVINMAKSEAVKHLVKVTHQVED